MENIESLDFFLYIIVMCALANYMAGDLSFFGVPVRDNIRPLFLIFNFNMIQISVFCLISQIGIYVSVLWFLGLKILGPRMTAEMVDSGYRLLVLILRIHMVIFGLGRLETGVCEWRHRKNE